MKTNFPFQPLITVLTAHDDAMIETILSQDLLSTIIPDIMRRTPHSSFVTDLLERIMSSRAQYLESVLCHPIWVTIKSVVFRKRVPAIGAWLSSGVLKSCKAATTAQMMFMIREDVLPKALTIVNTHDAVRHESRVEVADVAIKKLGKLMKQESHPLINECFQKLRILIDGQHIIRFGS